MLKDRLIPITLQEKKWLKRLTSPLWRHRITWRHQSWHCYYLLLLLQIFI